MRAMLKHSQTGALKDVPLGFSWTTLFFGIFPALFRGDFKNALIMFLLALFTLNLSWLIMPFFYNKMYVTDLVSKGWMPADQMSANTLRIKGIAFMSMDYNSPSQMTAIPANRNTAPDIRPTVMLPEIPAAFSQQNQSRVQQNIVNNIVCQLCQRRFDSQEHLDNHIMNSDLHKKNLETQAMQNWKQG